MTSCPKCSCTRILGPTYGRTALGREYLQYDCARCGYAETTETDDSQSKNKALSAMRLAAYVKQARGRTRSA